jgi:peptidylprolyl isomerase
MTILLALIFGACILPIAYYYYVIPHPSQLRILYTHSPEMVEEIVNSFKTWYGSPIQVTITKTSFQTAYEKAKAYTMDPEADIWWGGPLTLFNDAIAGLLQYNSTYKDAINVTCPFAQMDSRSTPYWYAASQSGLGIMYNKHALDALDLSKPQTWADLLDQRYFENITMTDPTNSELTSLFIMLTLQSKMQTTNGVQNWTAGWEYLVKLATSIKEYDNDESDTALKVSSSYLPLAIVPDFYAYDKMAIPVPDINFTYLDATILQPDPIAIFKKGKYLSEAKAFIDFILTQQAQSIIGKYVLPIRSEVTVFPPRINPFDSSFPFIGSYNKTFEEKMKQIVEDYYSVWFSQKHSQIRALWEGITEVNKTKGDNSLANYYYNLAYSNFTYLERYLNRTYIDKIYSLTGNWTDTTKKQPYITLWNDVCTTTYAYVAENIQLALGKTITHPTRILLVTSMGNITIELYDDMPITSENFKNLTEYGIYDGAIFHRVVHDFVIQGGDASAKGISVPTIPDELPNKHSNIRGSVAMAKTDMPNSATSQFYINLVDNLSLDSNYSVFGKVIAGMDVVDAIGNVSTDSNEKPLQDVTVIRAEIIK